MDKPERKNFTTKEQFFLACEKWLLAQHDAHVWEYRAWKKINAGLAQR